MKPIILAFVFLFVISPVFAQKYSEEEIIKQTTDTVLTKLKNSRAQLQKDPEYIQALVTEIIVPHFDFKRMSELVMGRYWDKFNKGEHDCFVSGFRNMLVERYAYILLSYDDQHISYDPVVDTGEKGHRMVRQTISREGAKSLPIEYKMVSDEGQWKVVDLVIDGVSLIRAHRGMFQSRIHTQGTIYFINNFPECKN